MAIPGFGCSANELKTINQYSPTLIDTKETRLKKSSCPFFPEDYSSCKFVKLQFISLFLSLAKHRIITLDDDKSLEFLGQAASFLSLTF
jgi:hypothetical protein